MCLIPFLKLQNFPVSEGTFGHIAVAELEILPVPYEMFQNVMVIFLNLKYNFGYFF